MEQAEFLKTVRKSLTDAQARAAARIETLEGDAKKALGDLVERGRHSQKDIADRLQKIAQSGIIQQKVRPAAEEAFKKVGGLDYRARMDKMGQELGGRVRELQHRAAEYVGASSRQQVLSLAGELRKLGEKMEKLATKEEQAAEKAPAPTEVH